MSLSENLQLQADKYLVSTLSESELKAFKLELTNNKALQDYISINQEMNAQYNDLDWQFLGSNFNNKVEELEQFFKKEETKELKLTLQKISDNYNNNSKKIGVKKKNIYPFLAVAASIMLLLGVFFYNSNKNLYSNYNTWNELPSLIERSASQNQMLQNAEQAFINKDYLTANTLYSQYIKQENTTNYNVYLYLGITQIELNKNEEALLSFNKVIESNSLDFSKGYWYKALTYLKIKDNANAIVQLEIIIKNPENYKFAEAKKLLEKLKD